MTHRARAGFTLLETAAVIGVGTLVMVQVMPTSVRTLSEARGLRSAGNLMLIGQGTDQYAMDHQGLIFNYSWRGPREGQPNITYTLPDGSQRTPGSDMSAAIIQNTEILQRRTGRIAGIDQILPAQNRYPTSRMRSLVLMDYLDLPFPSTLFADPSDEKLLHWQSDPTVIHAMNNPLHVPYAAGSIIPHISNIEPPSGWNTNEVRQRWAFSSSYLSTTSAWAPDGLDGEPTYVPTHSSPHTHGTLGSPRIADGRFLTEVRYPAHKVHMFEEFDRRQASTPYYGYDFARPAKLMFDGSVNTFASGGATPSWTPANPQFEWRQVYWPLHQFPAPVTGFGEQTRLSQRYRWTRFGLQGLDYPVQAPGRPAMHVMP